MHTAKRFRALVMLLPLTILAGLVLSGCHGSDDTKASAGYYTGPKGKGAANTDDTAGKSKGTNP